MKLRAFMVYLFLLTIALSCKDDELPGEVVLDRIIYDTDIERTDKYIYNNVGQVVRFDFLEGTELTQYSEYTYNIDNHLATRKYFIANQDNDFEQYYSSTFKYDSDTHLSEVLTIGAREISFKITWADGHITKVERIEGKSTTFLEFQYSREGNISTVVNYLEDGTINYVLECKYDNHANPFYDFKDPLEIVSGNVLKICPNNLTSIVQKMDFDGDPYGTTEITYVYNDEGRPKESVYKITSLGNTTESATRYFYRRL
jgi:hypothetical protein